MEKNQILQKKRQEEQRRKELEGARKCEEEVAQRTRISVARAELEIKHFEEKQGEMPFLGRSPPVEFILRSLTQLYLLPYNKITSHEKTSFR